MQLIKNKVHIWKLFLLLTKNSFKFIEQIKEQFILAVEFKNKKNSDFSNTATMCLNFYDY